MKKKVEFWDLKPGTVFKRKSQRTLFMAGDCYDAYVLTGKNKGVQIWPLDEELVIPTKVKISEVK